LEVGKDAVHLAEEGVQDAEKLAGRAAKAAENLLSSPMFLILAVVGGGVLLYVFSQQQQTARVVGGNLAKNPALAMA